MKYEIFEDTTQNFSSLIFHLSFFFVPLHSENQNH